MNNAVWLQPQQLINVRLVGLVGKPPAGIARLVFWRHRIQIDVDLMKDELLAIMLLPPSTWSMLQSDRLRDAWPLQ